MQYFAFPMWPDGRGKISLGELLCALPPNDLHWLMIEFDGFFRRDSGRSDYQQLIESVRKPPGHWFSWIELNEFTDTLGDTDWCTLIATRSRAELLTQLPIAEEEYGKMPVGNYFARYVTPLCPAADCIVVGFDSTSWELSFRNRFDPCGCFSPDRIPIRPPIPGHRQRGPARPLGR